MDIVTNYTVSFKQVPREKKTLLREKRSKPFNSLTRAIEVGKVKLGVSEGGGGGNKRGGGVT